MPVPITAPQSTSVIKWFHEAKRKPAVEDARAKLETTTGIFHGEFEKYLQNKNEVKPAAAKLNVVCPEINDLSQSPSRILFSGAPQKYM